MVEPTSPNKSCNDSSSNHGCDDERFKMAIEKSKLFLDNERAKKEKRRASMTASVPLHADTGLPGKGSPYVHDENEPIQASVELSKRSRRASMGAIPKDAYGVYGTSPSLQGPAHLAPHPRTLQDDHDDCDGYGTDCEAATPSKRSKARRASVSFKSNGAGPTTRRSRRASMSDQNDDCYNCSDEGLPLQRQPRPVKSSGGRRASMSGAMPRYDQHQDKASRRMSNHSGRRGSAAGNSSSRRKSVTGGGAGAGAAPEVVKKKQGINDALARMQRRMSGAAGHAFQDDDDDDDEDEPDYGYGAVKANNAYGYGYNENANNAYGYGGGRDGPGVPTRGVDRRNSGRSQSSAASKRSARSTASSRSRRRNSCLIRKDVDQTMLAQIMAEGPARMSDSEMAQSSGEDDDGVYGYCYDSGLESESEQNNNFDNMSNMCSRRRSNGTGLVQSAPADPISAMIEGRDEDDNDLLNRSGYFNPSSSYLSKKTPKTLGNMNKQVLEVAPPSRVVAPKLPSTAAAPQKNRSAPFTTSRQTLTKESLLATEKHVVDTMIPGYSMRTNNNSNWGEIGIDSDSSCDSDDSGDSCGASMYKEARVIEIDRYKQRARRRSSLEKTWYNIADLSMEGKSGKKTAVPDFTPATNCNNASDFILRCFCARLRAGITVIKHNQSRWSKSQLRILYLLPDGKTLSWKPIEGGQDKGKRPKLDLMKCKEVRHAWTRDPSTRKQVGTSVLRKRCKDGVANKSYSLIFNKRTLDMTALSSDQCRLMMEGFSALCFRLQFDRLQDDGHESDDSRRRRDNITTSSQSIRCSDDDWASTVYGGESTVSMTQTAASVCARPAVSSWGL